MWASMKKKVSRSQDSLGHTKEAIIQAAIVLVGNGGLGALTLSGLAQQAGLSRQNLYYHFKDPNDVLLYLAERWGQTGQQETLRALAQTTYADSERLLAMADGMFQWMEKYPDLARLGVVFYQNANHKKLKSLLEGVVEKARDRIYDLLLLGNPKLKSYKRSELEPWITSLHSAMYGSYFYSMAVQDSRSLAHHRQSCLATLRALLKAGP